MHKIAIPDYALARAAAQRGQVRFYDEMVGAKTALVVVDLQNVFMLPGMPVEVPTAREIVPNVNRLARAVNVVGARLRATRVAAT